MRLHLTALLVTSMFIACASFGGDDEGGGPSAPSGDDGGSPDGAMPDLVKDPRTFVLLAQEGEAPFVVPGEHLELPVKIQRGTLFHDAVTLTLTGLPSGFRASPATIAADERRRPSAST